MPKWFRIWHKKRGDRQTGSPWVGSVSEAVFYWVLFGIGALFLTLIVLSHNGFSIPFTPQLTGLSYWLMVIVLVSFLVIGGLGGGYALWNMGVSAERRSALASQAAAGIDKLQEGTAERNDFPTIPRNEDLTNSPGISLAFRLPIAQTSLWGLAVAGIFSVTCVGATIGLGIVALPTLGGENPRWLMAFFSLLLAAASGWSIYYFLRQWMRGAGVGATSLEISDHPLRPGFDYEFFLTQQGRMRLRCLSVTLICEETAIYRQGTDVRTETVRVAEHQIFRGRDIHIQPAAPIEYQGSFTVPPEAMHSFQSRNNSVTWKIEVRGEIEQWPSFQRSYPVIVHPAPSATQSRPETAESGAGDA